LSNFLSQIIILLILILLVFLFCILSVRVRVRCFGLSGWVTVSIFKQVRAQRFDELSELAAWTVWCGEWWAEALRWFSIRRNGVLSPSLFVRFLLLPVSMASLIWRPQKAFNPSSTKPFKGIYLIESYSSLN